MDKLQVVKFDVRGTNPDNRVLLEKIPILDKTCPWVVPNGSPFFAEELLVTLLGQTGAKLRLGVDYWFEGEFPPFCELTGRSICSFIKLSDRTREQNKFITATYQSIGAWFVPRNSIDEWVEQIHNGKIPIPWSKVYNVPPELPVEFHSHSIKTEIRDWYELTFFFNYMANIYRTRDPAVYANADRIITESFEQLLAVKATQLARLNNHDKDYGNPHQLDKFRLNLGNLDNYGTATFAQTLAGTASNLFTTSEGTLALSEGYEQDTSAAMRTGVLPISYFGGDSFIPPLISGSFEGLGSRSAATGVCLENTGQVMILQNHFDGRVNGLYFTQVENHRSANPKISYSGYRYEPPDLINKGVSPDSIICGSGNKAIMVGVDGTNNWYVALTNGSFNPATHQYVKCNVAAIIAAIGGSTYIAHGQSTIVDTERYLLLVHPVGSSATGEQAATGEQFAIFRVSKAAIRAGNDVTWELLKLTYPDYNGVVKSNQNYLKPFTLSLDAQSRITGGGPWTFKQPATSSRRAGKPVAFACDLKSSPGMSMFHIMWYMTYFMDGITANLITETGYVLNPETGVMSINNKTPSITIDFTGTTPNQRADYIEAYYKPFNQIGLSNIGTTILPDGVLVSPYPNSSNLFPLYFRRVVFKGLNTREDVLVRGLDVQSIGVSIDYVFTPNIVRSPIASGGYPCSLAYEPNGEMFNANDPLTNVRKTFFRKVTGAYQVRPGINNLEESPLNSRPLTNNIYLSNIAPGDGVVTLTGTAAHLGTAGLEMGSCALSMGGWTSSYPTINHPSTPALMAPAGNNLIGSFPRTSSKTLNESAKTVTYKGDSFYGFRQGFIDQVKNLIPAAYRSTTPSWCFLIQMLEEVNGGMFFGLDVGVLTISYYDQVNNNARTQLVLFRPVVEAPGGNHPTAHLLTSLTVLDLPPDVLGMGGTAPIDPLFTYSYLLRPKPMFSGYRVGNYIKCYSSSIFGNRPATIATQRMCTFFDINLTSLKFENIAQGSWHWNSPDFVMMIPKEGMTDLNLAYNNREVSTGSVTYPGPSGNVSFNPFDPAGGAASLYPKAGQWYLNESSYPESGWVIYFQAGIKLMIEGTLYETEGGSVDLRDVTPDPRNKTFYLYCTIEDSKPKYLLSTIKLRRGNALLLVGSVTTNATQIITIDRKQPFVVGDYEMSYVREGGIIPVSTGLPQDEGTFRFLKVSELLP